MNTPVSGGAVSDDLTNLRLYLIGADLDNEIVKRGILALTQPAVPVLASEPVLYQYRMRPGWVEPAQWQAWSDCSAESAADYERTPLLHDWHYEVRRLYLAAPQPAPTPSHDPAMFRRMQDLWLRCDAHIAKYADAILSGALAAPLASEPEPVAAEQARDDSELVRSLRAKAVDCAYVSGLIGDNELAQAKIVLASMGELLREKAAALASQSTPPPESAGQGLSDAQIDAVITAEGGWSPFDSGDLHSFARAILAANRTAQQDGGSKA